MYKKKTICYNFLIEESFSRFFVFITERRAILSNRIREGDIYRVLRVDGKRFEILYGYYEEKDRISKYNDPIPIYPDFIKEPLYNQQGQPFVTEMQDMCEHFKGKMLVDICCGCTYYKKGDDLIGTCTCPLRERQNE